MVGVTEGKEFSLFVYPYILISIWTVTAVCKDLKAQRNLRDFDLGSGKKLLYILYKRSVKTAVFTSQGLDLQVINIRVSIPRRMCT